MCNMVLPIAQLQLLSEETFNTASLKTDENFMG